ncbi:MAG: bifunctional UDP-N-acetylmuramoyl-tripeptide:D-alanyl-D-alanine ligase/alanine racemase, partial [Bacteroidaceae bacterium]|nr:bifunctional UDP-N-acetylmuramoyl-tripeptide:D-alanyl-D-alanine ligase/alanine racemase [Bacteroidaceae bacterium]
VPLSVWLMNESTELGIFEAGISEMREMEALQSIIRPTIGVLTNIGGAHQENFFSLEDKCMEKLALFKDCDVVVYDGDNRLISNCVSKSLFSSREIAWSRTDNERPLFIESIEKGETSTTIQYRYLGMPNQYVIPFIDEASIENSLHCLAVALYLMLSPEKIRERMAGLEQVAMRLEVKEGQNGCILINDSYNSDLASLDIALDFMSRRSEDKGRKRTLILSDLLETGQSSKLLYRQVAELVHNRQVDKIIGVGEEIRSAASRFEIEKYFFRTTEELLASDLLAELKNEVILVKGSRSFRFDEVTDRLELKVHETILEINLNALVDNLNHYRSKLKPETKMVCMVKASAYGAGSYEIAKTLQDHRVDYLAVAVADEGSDLRKAGITSSIIIMNPELTAFKTLFDYKLEPEVYSFNLLNELIKAAEKEGVTNFPVHIKIDTGMHRLGFAPSDIPELIARLKRQSSVIPRSVFSHLVGSDSTQFDDFTRMQIETFERVSNELQSAFSHKILRHICNTAGIGRYPEAQLDMVRLGLGLYGVDPFSNSILSNVSTLKTTILQIRNVPKEDSVGYSRKGLLNRDSRIAAIPIGYADGLNRRLGNGNAYCMVNGQKAPYVGNICMDVCMIDVTDIDCKEGDKVIIFGDELPVTVLSDVLGTIPYEILTSVSNRVKRVYFQN